MQASSPIKNCNACSNRACATMNWSLHIRALRCIRSVRSCVYMVQHNIPSHTRPECSASTSCPCRQCQPPGPLHFQAGSGCLPLHRTNFGCVTLAIFHTPSAVTASSSHIDRALTLDARPFLSDLGQQRWLHEHQPLKVYVCILSVICLCSQPEAVSLCSQQQPGKAKSHTY